MLKVSIVGLICLTLFSAWLADRPQNLGSQTASDCPQRPAAHDMFCRSIIPPTKEEVHVFASVCLSVCLLARLLKIACVDLDEMLHVDRCRDMDELINF